MNIHDIGSSGSCQGGVTSGSCQGGEGVSCSHCLDLLLDHTSARNQHSAVARLLSTFPLYRSGSRTSNLRLALVSLPRLLKRGLNLEACGVVAAVMESVVPTGGESDTSVAAQVAADLIYCILVIAGETATLQRSTIESLFRCCGLERSAVECRVLSLTTQRTTPPALSVVTLLVAKLRLLASERLPCFSQLELVIFSASPWRGGHNCGLCEALVAGVAHWQGLLNLPDEQYFMDLLTAHNPESLSKSLISSA